MEMKHHAFPGVELECNKPEMLALLKVQMYQDHEYHNQQYAIYIYMK